MFYIKKYFFVASLSALSIIGCSTPQLKHVTGECDVPSPAVEANNPPESQLQGRSLEAHESAKREIKTRGEYHNAVLAYENYKTPFSFFLVGIEKPRGKYKRPYCQVNDNACDFPVFDPSQFKGDSSDDQGGIDDTQADIDDRLFNDPKSMVPTHVLKVRKTTSDTANVDRNECFVFNVYGHYASTPWCENSLHSVDVDKPDWTGKAWKGLDLLGDEIKATAKREKATHIILLATGWATVEYESFRDFDFWMTELGKDFEGTEFRPIYIGIAWESGFPTVGDTLSFATKGNDADEIGFTWINYLFNVLLKPIAGESDAKLVAIGHSFGSRIALGSHYVRDVLVRPTSTLDTPVTLIGMQAAFPTGRFISQEGDEHQYVPANKANARVIITASDSDKATHTLCYYDFMGWEIGTGFVGGPCGLEQVKNNPALYKEAITLLETSNNGQPNSGPVLKQVSLYDASPFVDCQLKGTASGSHSDVYDREMGHFLGEVIRSGGT